MSIEIRWYDTYTHIVHWTFHGQWAWDDFFATFEQEKQMVATLDGARYDIIGEFMDHPTLPHGSGAVSHVVGTLRHRKATHMGLLVVVTRNTFIRAMVKIATQLHPGFRTTFFSTDSLQAAEAAIQQSRVQR